MTNDFDSNISGGVKLFYFAKPVSSEAVSHALNMTMREPRRREWSALLEFSDWLFFFRKNYIELVPF